MRLAVALFTVAEPSPKFHTYDTPVPLVIEAVKDVALPSSVGLLLMADKPAMGTAVIVTGVVATILPA